MEPHKAGDTADQCDTVDVSYWISLVILPVDSLVENFYDIKYQLFTVASLKIYYAKSSLKFERIIKFESFIAN